ncbi:MAG TPA: zf-HC2 domain-containing protein [Myxococcota bacterium]|nr:zf-HC2 domain-containing protein [Myxococcota bacterium]
MSAVCQGNAPSWLTLELYQLGELPGSRRAEVEEHLEDCPTCRDCLEKIRADENTALAPLSPAMLQNTRPARPRQTWVIAATTAACAALLVVFLLPRGPHKGRPVLAPAPARIAYKGGELSMALVRERAGATLNDPETFMPSDRFMVLVTCPPGEELFWDLVVFQNGQPSFPLDPKGVLACGNRLPLPGAFRLTGSIPAAVCLLTAPQAVKRADIAANPEKLPRNTICLALKPVF